jgi:hypothetical protein
VLFLSVKVTRVPPIAGPVLGDTSIIHSTSAPPKIRYLVEAELILSPSTLSTPTLTLPGALWGVIHTSMLDDRTVAWRTSLPMLTWILEESSGLPTAK